MVQPQYSAFSVTPMMPATWQRGRTKSTMVCGDFSGLIRLISLCLHAENKKREKIFMVNVASCLYHGTADRDVEYDSWHVILILHQQCQQVVVCQHDALR